MDVRHIFEKNCGQVNYENNVDGSLNNKTADDVRPIPALSIQEVDKELAISFNDDILSSPLLLETSINTSAESARSCEDFASEGLTFDLDCLDVIKGADHKSTDSSSFHNISNNELHTESTTNRNEPNNAIEPSVLIDEMIPTRDEVDRSSIDIGNEPVIMYSNLDPSIPPALIAPNEVNMTSFSDCFTLNKLHEHILPSSRSEDIPECPPHFIKKLDDANIILDVDVINKQVNKKINIHESNHHQNILIKFDHMATISRPVVHLPHRNYETLPLIDQRYAEICYRKPVFRLSFRIPFFSKNSNIPSAECHKQWDKSGFLQKLVGRGFPYLNQWKRRYCVLSKGFLFVYENEHQKTNDKNAVVIDLKYFDHITEAAQKETKKASNVFVVTTQDKTFFDQGRHLFSADTLTEMHEWMTRLRDSVEQIRNNNRTSSTSVKSDRRKSRELASKQNKDEVVSSLPPQQEAEQSSRHIEITEATPLPPPDKLEVEATQPIKVAPRLFPKAEAISEIISEPEDSLRTEAIPIQPKAAPPLQRVASRVDNKVLLDSPDSKPLESITKNRPRGPAGRRAPQNRKTALMKQRASSMSALQPDLNGSSENGRCDIYEQIPPNLQEGHPPPTEVINSSHPVLAYHYSSDEESQPGSPKMMTAGVIKSASGVNHGSGSSGNFSWNNTSAPSVDPGNKFIFGRGGIIEKNRNKEFYSGFAAKFKRHGSPPLVENHNKNDDLLEYRSLPKSLRKKHSPPQHHVKGDTLLMKLPTFESYSSTRLCSASPEMDELDNLLMTQSIRPSNSTRNIDGIDDNESEGSTCKHQEDERQTETEKKILKSIDDFSTVIQQVQYRSTDLELRTNRLEVDFSLSKNDVDCLHETSRNLKTDVDNLAKAVSIISEEAATAQKDLVAQRKENESLQRTTHSALKEAKTAFAECEKAKMNYESLIKELHSLISSIRTSLIVTEDDQLATPIQEKKPTNQNEKKQQNSLEKGKQSKTKPTNEQKKEEKSKAASKDQKVGYQSFFQRPSSLIYTLTNRSASKSTSAIDTKGKERKKDKDENKTNKQTNSWERNKQNKVEKSQNSLERKSRSSSNVNGNKNSSKSKDQSSGSKMSSRPRETSRSRDKISKLISGRSEDLSFEDIPMMDDIRETADPKKKTNVASGISHITINVSAPVPSNRLEKSVSSPTMSLNTGKNARKPNFLNISPSEDLFGSTSNNASPSDSPTNNAHFFDNFGSDREFRFADTEGPSPFYPKHANVIRQSSMSSVPEDRPLPTNKGTFAISRQNSSPNIPLQRQSSGTLFPIQRQHSLGTVPEEGTLPRQLSLLSVPEEDTRPIVDQTLPLSPSPSLISFPLSRTSSAVTDNGFRSPRSSMELLTGPVIAGSQLQESLIRSLPPATEFQSPLATSSLRRRHEAKRNSKIVHV